MARFATLRVTASLVPLDDPTKTRYLIHLCECEWDGAWEVRLAQYEPPVRRAKARVLTEADARETMAELMELGSDPGGKWYVSEHPNQRGPKPPRSGP